MKAYNRINDAKWNPNYLSYLVCQLGKMYLVKVPPNLFRFRFSKVNSLIFPIQNVVVNFSGHVKTIT